MTKDPEFFKWPYQKHIPGQADKYCILFTVPLETTKDKAKLGFI